MAKIAIGWQNLLASSNCALSASSSVATLPVANLKDPMQTRRLRTVPGVTTLSVTADLGTAAQLQLFAFSQPWDAGDVYDTDNQPRGIMAAFDTIRYQVANVGDFSTLIYDSGVLPCGIDKLNRLSVHLAPAAVSGRFVRFIIDAPSLSTLPGYLDIATVWAGPAFMPARNFDYGAGQGILPRSKMSEAVGGGVFTRRYAPQRQQQFTLSYLTVAELNETVMPALGAMEISDNILVLPDPASPYLQRQAILGRIENAAELSTLTAYNVQQRPFLIKQAM